MREGTHSDAQQGVTWRAGWVVAGRYRLQSVVGAGGMGVVWRAVDLRLDRTVALKQLRLSSGRPPEEAGRARQRVFREARIAARLQHPNAVAVYDVTLDDHGQPILVLEYLPSQSLAAALATTGTLPPTRVARIGAAVASALEAAHAAGIVHRDVKPGNVLLATDTSGRDGTVKITDFGLSHAIGDVTVTSTGLLVGTPAFLSPEAARGEASGPASDVFSLGATLYAAVEGTPPFDEADNPIAQLHRVAAGQAPPPRQAGPLTQPLTSMLRDDPTSRPTMSQVAAMFTAIVDGRQLSATETHDGPRPARAALPTTAATHSPAPTRLDLHPASSNPSVVAGRRVTRAALGLLAAGLLTLLAITLATTGNDGGTNATPPSTTQPSAESTAPTGPAGVDPALLRQAVTDYYTLLPDDTDQAWARLGPAMQAQDREQYDKFWDDVKELRVRTTPQVSGSSVVVEIEYTQEGRGRIRETRQHDMLVRDGAVLINSDQVLSTQVSKGNGGNDKDDKKNEKKDDEEEN